MITVSMDIHFCVERFDRSAQKWTRAESIRLGDDELEVDYWYTGHSVPLFALLGDKADARLTGITPILAQLRGLPDHPHQTTYESLGRPHDEGGPRTVSYLTATELVRHDWFHTATRRGAFVNPIDFWRWDKFRRAPVAPVTILPPGAIEYGHDQMRTWLYESDTDVDNVDDRYTWITWDEVHQDTFADFVPVVLRMARLAVELGGGDLNNVRCVYGIYD